MSNLTIADVLERAADLIEPEGKWTQFHYARDRNGRPTSYEGSTAVCFCPMGAIGKVSEDYRLEVEAARLLARDMKVPACADTGPTSVVEIAAISNWNDASERTQAEVVAKLREAAALARERQA